MSISSVSSTGSPYTQPVQPSPLKQAGQDYAALSKALGSGNLATAQSAFASLQQDMQAAQKAQGGESHHHHHHHGGGAQPAQATTAATAVTGASGGTINTTA